MEVGASSSAAALAGLKSGDIIVEFDGKPVDSAQDLIAKVSANYSGTIAFRSTIFARIGEQLNAGPRTMRLGERPARQPKRR